MVRTHGINPPYSKMSQNRSGKAERLSHASEPAPKARYSKYGLTPCGNGVLSSATIMDEI